MAVALGALHHARGASGRTRPLILDHVRDLAELSAQLSAADVKDAIEAAAALTARGVDVVMSRDREYPGRLLDLRNPPPVLFHWGNRALFDVPSVGMCGSRRATDSGLRAARACGEAVASLDLAIVSGYARGVDTETHLAALETGGRTVIVLAEGISHFRQKKSFASTGLPEDRVLVVSQFPPSQTWNPGAAMTRNRVITGLSEALIVIEAGDRGGTLDAGLQALSAGRPVLALEFKSMPTPPGNELLFAKGATRIRSLGELIEKLRNVASRQRRQLRIL